MNRFIQGLALVGVIVFTVPAATSAADALDAVKANIEAGRSDAAVKTLQSMVASNPEDYQAWFLLGVASSRQQRFHQAIEAFRRVIELKPELAEPHNNLAVIYNELGDVRAAVKELEASLAKRPGYAVAEENIGDLYVKLALQHYRSALARQASPALEQRYTRLLQVRDPASGAAAERDAAQLPTDQEKPAEAQAAAPAAQPEKPEPVADAAVQETAPQPMEAPLPQKLPVIDAMADQKKASASDSELPEPVRAEIVAAVERWRSAWSARDVEAYFAAYASDFEVPARFTSLDEWKKYKRRVISSKRWIKVELSEMTVAIDDESGHARVKFFQKFSSNSYTGDDRKLLEMQFDGADWKIVREVSAS